MVLLQPARLRNQAQRMLDRAAYNPKTLVLIHAGVSLGVSLLIAVLNFVLDFGIAETGGLGGLGMRSVLTSAQTVLQLAASVVLPFWNIGLLFAALHWAKGENATPHDLLQGFRRFAAIFGLYFVQGGLYLVLGMAVYYVSSMLFMLTPYAAPLIEQLQPLYESATELTPQLMAQLTKQMMPLLILFGVLFAAVAIPVAYRLRFAQYGIMEGGGTVQSMVHSVRITKGSVLQLVKLDLSFWWFYLLQALTVLLCYGDQLLPAMGISLPISPDAGYFLFYALGIVAQCILLWQYQANVSTCYCLAYKALDPRQEETI